MRFLCIIVFPLILYTVGILLFTKGFLLKRITIARNSTCARPLTDDGSTGHLLEAPSDCWVQPSFRKSVLIIIDALRFDFVTYDQSLRNEVPFYRNKLTCMYEAARDRPNNARIYRFIADPPTTTLQRLKGLTTGSLPTFVDAGANFASNEISEDNIINQFASLGNNLTFMGDDTWQVKFYMIFASIVKFKIVMPMLLLNCCTLTVCELSYVRRALSDKVVSDTTFQ